MFSFILFQTEPDPLLKEEVWPLSDFGIPSSSSLSVKEYPNILLCCYVVVALASPTSSDPKQSKPHLARLTLSPLVTLTWEANWVIMWSMIKAQVAEGSCGCARWDGKKATKGEIKISEGVQPLRLTKESVVKRDHQLTIVDYEAWLLHALTKWVKI